MARLSPDNTILLVCDIQERFRDLLLEFPSVVKSTNTLLDAAKILGYDAIATEQYPKGLLRTVPELRVKERGLRVFEKTKFSMLTPEVKEATIGYTSFIITGLETHVCVLQTCLELLDKGLNVYVVVDAVSSQRKCDRDVALHRLAAAGAKMITTESMMFMWLGDASHPKFREISNLAKEYGKAPSQLGFL